MASALLLGASLRGHDDFGRGLVPQVSWLVVAEREMM